MHAGAAALQAAIMMDQLCHVERLSASECHEQAVAIALLGRAGADRVRVSACIQLIAKLVACPPLVKPYRT
jgi:hypothetical protein